MTEYGNSAGASAGRWAQELRATARRGVWRRVASWLGVTAHTRRADVQAACADAGRVGEQKTARLLFPLQDRGWKVLHDRALPGADRANADHIVISPGGRLFLIDSKMWSVKKGPVHLQGGRLMHGPYDKGQAVRSLEFERVLVERALQTPVTALIVVHQAPVRGGGFHVGHIPVLTPQWLVALLRANDAAPNPGALGLAQTAERVFPPYMGRR